MLVDFSVAPFGSSDIRRDNEDASLPEAVRKYGSRISLILRADIRSGHSGELKGKVERLNQAMKSGQGK